MLDHVFDESDKKDKSDSKVAVETRDPEANRDAATAEKDRFRRTGETLHSVEIVPEGEKPPEAKKPEEKPVDRNEMEKAADALEEACNGGWTGAGTDKDTVYAILKDKTEAERKVIDQIFREKYGKDHGDAGDGSDWGLAEEFADEMEGADLDKAMNLLNKKDGKADDAGRIHTALVERDQTFEGRSDETCEKDIRDTVATMNSKQIAELDKEYQERYGKSVRDAVMDDPNLAAATKEALDIYLKGSDKRTADDTIKLADIAIREEDVDMFQEAMRDASPEARKRFMDEGGEARMKEAFGGVFSDSDLDRAKEYADKGSLSTKTKISDNTSWSGDNEKAIEQSIAEMTAAERKAYLDGRNMSEGKEVSGLTPEQKAEALKTYQEINTALKDAGNENEVAKWEDQISVKGGSIVTRLAAHRGSIYDDSTHDVLSTIENMPEADWKRLKADPEFRKEIERSLGTYLEDDEMTRARALLDAKQKAETFDESTASARRSVIDAITDNVGTFNNKETNIYESIEKMTPDEQRRYREDPEFKKQLDEAVKNALDEGAELDTVVGMLDKVAAGEKPTRGIIDKLNEHAADTDTDEAAVIRDMRKAFAEDPTLRERLVNPQTAADQELATKFDTALRRALDDDEYQRYAKPLLETGHLSLEIQNELNAGYFDDDEQGVYKDALALAGNKSPEAAAERQKILTDKEYQDKVFSFVSDDERKVALYALEQGKMLPEDVIRSHLLGAGTGETEVKEALRELNPEQIDQLKKDYARKYGEDLTYSLLDEMGGQDARDVSRATAAKPATGREAYNDARDELYESRDGVGKWWVDNVWDGTGYMTDDAANKFAAAMSKSSAEFKELSPEQQKELTEQVQKNLDMFVESKGAAADMAVDAVIIAAAIAGAKFTGGVSLALLTKTALAGAVFKVAAKSTIMGADYDWASSQVVVDSLTGAVDAATIVVGPAQLAQVFKLGEKAAATATSKLLAEGGEQLLKVGAEKQVGKKMFEVVATAISNGAEGVDDKAIKAIAKEFAKEGQEEALEAALKQNLKEAMEQEARTAIKRSLTETTLNMEAGAIGGGTSGGIRGVAEWDTSKSFSENLTMVAQSTAMGAGMGTVMAGTFTLAFKGVGKTFEAIRGAGPEAPPVHPDTDVVIGGQRVKANQEVVAFRADGSPATASDSTSKLQVSFMRDSDGRMMMMDHSESGTWVKRAGSDKFERVPFGEPVPVKPGDEVRLGSETGAKLDLGTAKTNDAALARTAGEVVQEGPGNARVNSRTADGKVASVTDVHGRQSSFEYGADGAVNKITHSDGTVLTTTDGKNWKVKTGDSDLSLAAEFHVGRDGTLWQKTPKGELVATHPDGSRMVREVGGTSRLYNQDGVLHELVTPGGERTRIQYNNRGEVSQLTHHDGTIVRTEDGTNWKIVDTDGQELNWRGKIEVDGEGHLKTTKEPRPRAANTPRELRDEPVGRAADDDPSMDEPVRAGGGSDRPPAPRAKDGGQAFRAGDDVHYDGQDHKLIAFDPTTGEAIIEDASKRSYAGIMRNISASELARDYREIKIDDDVFYRHKDGSFYTVMQRPDGGNIIYPKHDMVAVPRDALERVTPVDYGRTVYGLALPDRAGFRLGNKDLDLGIGDEIKLGRDIQGLQAPKVSRNHASVGRDDKGLYIRDDGSSNGTFIKRNGAPEFDVIKPGEKVYIRPGDDVRLGSADGPKLEGLRFPEGQLQALEALRPAKALEQNQGKIELGRNHVLPDGRPLQDHPQVSRNHGEMRWDEKEKAFFFQDHSSRGTWVQREGTEGWTKVQDQEVRLGPNDKLRLGSADGPEVPVSAFRRPDIAPFGRAEDAQIYIGEHKLSLVDGSVQVGRGHGQVTDSRVSRSHGTLRFDNGDKSFHYKDHSNNGSYIRREGSNVFEEVRGKEVKIGPRDEVRLGSPDGPRLDLVAKSQQEVVSAAENSLGRKVFVNGKEIEVADGNWRSIGRDSTPSGGQHDGLDKVASRNHANIRLDEKTGQIHLVDTSENGTWIRPAGSDQWVVVTKNMEVTINPGDEVRLGSQFGPELKLSHIRGEIRPDGSVYFKRPEGDYWRNTDGTTVFSDRAGIHRWADHTDRVTAVRDASGNFRNYKYNPDGSLGRVEFPNNQVMESPDGYNWTTIAPDGKKTTSRGTMSVDQDGSLRVSNQGDVPKVYRLDGTSELYHPSGRIEYLDANMKVERQRLSSLTDAHFNTPEQKARMQRFMQEFETSAKARGVSDQEIAMTYHHVNRLLQGGADAPISQADRVRLAEQLLHQVAYPQAIDQGGNGTCNVTTIEKRIYARNPSEAARLVTDVATTGKYVTKDGTIVDMSRVPGALAPDKESQIALSKPFSRDGSDVKVDRRRTYASQIFEITAVNIKYAKGSGEFSLKPGDVVHYEKPFDKVGSDSGERLFRYSVGPDGKLQRTQIGDSPELWEWELTNIHNQITEGYDKNFVIYGPLRGVGDNTGSAVKVNSAAELEKTLISLYQQKEFPAVITVHTSKPPFSKITDEAAGGNGGWHVVNIQNIYRGKDGKIYVEFTNQWGSEKNHMGKKAVAVDVLFEATKKKTS